MDDIHKTGKHHYRGNKLVVMLKCDAEPLLGIDISIESEPPDDDTCLGLYSFEPSAFLLNPDARIDKDIGSNAFKCGSSRLKTSCKRHQKYICSSTQYTSPTLDIISRKTHKVMISSHFKIDQLRMHLKESLEELQVCNIYEDLVLYMIAAGCVL
jgi:hypothetical protein